MGFKNYADSLIKPSTSSVGFRNYAKEVVDNTKNNILKKQPNMLETKNYPNELLGDPLMSLVPNPIQDIKDNRINADVDKLSFEAREIKKVIDTYNSWEIPFANGKGRTYQKSVEARQNAITAREQFLKDAGFSSIEEAESSLKQKQNYASSVAKVQTIAQERQKMAELSDYIKTPEYEKNFQGYNSFIAEKENEQKKTSTFPLIDNAMLPDSFVGVAVKNYANASKNAKNDVTQYKVTDDWSATDKAELAKLYSKDPEKAMEFAKIVNTAIKNEEYRKTGEEYPILSSIASVPVSVLGGVDYVRNLVEYGTDKVMGRDAKLERSALSDLSGSLRQGVTDGTDWKIGNFDAFDFLYGVGMSMADMAAASMLGGGVNAITSKLATKLGTSVGGKILGKALTSIGSGSVLGLSVASSTMNDVLDRGGTDAQALTSGLVAGAFETLFESLSIGELKSMGRTSKEAFKELIKKSGKENVKILFKRLGVDALKSMGTNATEEAATELANVLYDTFANGDVSNYAIMVENYMKEDPTLTEEEAREKAIKQFTGQVLESAASGAIMGLFLGNGATVKAYMGANRQIQVNNAFDSAKKNIESNRLNNSINGVSGLQTESDADISEIGPNIKTQMNVGVRDSVSNVKNNLMQSAAKGSATTPNIFNLSAANPKNDIVGDAIAKSSGVPNRTDDQRLLRKIGKAFDVNVDFADLDEMRIDDNGKEFLFSPEGKYNKKTNTIILNTNVKDYHRPVQFIVKHELTHSLEKNQGLYNDFANSVMDSQEFKNYIKTKGFTSAQEWNADIRKRYSEQNVEGFSGNNAELLANQEMVADFVGDMLFGGQEITLERLLMKLTPEERNGFVEWIEQIFAKLRQVFTGREALNEIEILEKKFLKTARKVAKLNESGQQKNTTEVGSEVQYSTISDFKQQVDSVLKGSFDKNNHVYMGNTPERLVNILGIQKRPMLVTNNHIYSMSVSESQAKIDGRYNNKTNYHNLGEIVKELPELLNKPVLIIKSNTNPTDASFVVIVDKADKDGNPIFVAIKPNGKGNYYNVQLESTILLSSYGKDSYLSYLAVAKNEGRIVYAYKNSQQNKATGVQFPNNIMSADYSNNLARFKPIVNSYSIQKNEKYSIVGPKSHTANLENLEKAKERDQRLKGTKANSENTRRKYGWFRGFDRMWRYEISDEDAELTLLNPEYNELAKKLQKVSAEYELPYNKEAMEKMDEIVVELMKLPRYREVKVLSDILKHDKLYEAYPELADYKVEMSDSDSMGDAIASHNGETKSIKINKDKIGKADISVIMHEVQHAIQNIEGFAGGGSIQYWEDRKDLIKLHNSLKKQVGQEISDKHGNAMLELAKEYATTKDENRFSKLEDVARKNKCIRLFKLYRDYEQAALNVRKEVGRRNAKELYRDTAGEIEARDVMSRINMTDEERAATRPNVDKKNAVFTKHLNKKAGLESDSSVEDTARSKGYTEKLYHQTGEDFTEFDTEHQKAGKYDPEMPTGTFLKPTDADIGLEGNKQMELYTKIKNPIQFNDRADAVRFWKRNVEGYAEAVRKIDRVNTEYREKSFLAQEDVQSYLKEWRENNPTASRREIYKDSEYQRLSDIEQDVLEEWENASNEASLEAKKLIDAYMSDSGYDGVVVEKDQGSRGRTVKTYVVFDSSQMKSADAVTYDDNGNEIPLSARFDSSKKDIRYSIPHAETNKNKVMNPVEIANLKPEDALVTPKLEQKERSIPEGKLKTSKFFESSIDSPLITPSLKIDISNNEFIKTYRSITNRETLNKAQARLQEQGSQAVIDFKNLKEDEAAPVDIAMGFILLVEYQRVGDLESAAVVAEKLRSFGTTAGQAVQLYSILQRFTPDMMQMYAQKELDKAFEILRKKKFQKWADANRESFKLTDEDVEFIRRRTLQAALVEDNSRIKAVLIGEIQARIQSKLPSNVGDAIRSLQRSAMLLNLKTFDRNVSGNISSAFIYLPSDFFGSIIDKVVAKKTGQRTRGNVRLGDADIYKAFGKGIYESWDDFKRGIHTKQEGMNRYDINTSHGKSFNENITGKLAKLNGIAHVLNKIDNFTSFTLEVGDRPFFEMWMTNSLNNLMKLNNVSEATPEMVELAFQEALQRTWQDDNKFSNAVSGIKRFLNAIPVRAPGTDYGLGDWVIKFVKTPSNIAKAIVEVSPVGFALVPQKALEYQKALSRGELTLKEQKDFVDSLSKAITGTLIYTMVAVLAGMGAIELSGGGDDDKDAANFEKYIVGVHPYSIKIFGKWISYEWNQPIGAVLATVADFMENKKSNPDSALEDDLLNAFKGGMSVFANQSFLKSVSELFSGEDWVEGILNSILSEPAAFIPQVSSQFASFFDEYRRTTYDPTSEWQSAINNLIYKIPFLRETLPTQINVLGEKVENIQYLNPWEAFAAPGNRYPESSGKVAEEIYQLYKDTGDVAVMPRTAPTNIKVGGQKFVFTAQGRNNIQQVMGGISSDILSFVFDSDEYDKLDETQKVKVVSNVYSYAYAIAKSKLDLGYNALSNLIGEDDKGNPILSEETYNKLTPEAREILAREDLLSKAEEKCKQDPQKLAKLFIDKAKK